jgi:hypothetical protein
MEGLIQHGSTDTVEIPDIPLRAPSRKNATARESDTWQGLSPPTEQMAVQKEDLMKAHSDPAAPGPEPREFQLR